MIESIKFDSQITEIEKINPLISKVLVRIAYDGMNRNNSYIRRTAFDNAQFSLIRCPIIGEYKESIEDFGGHGGKLEVSDRSIKWVNTTIPYGFIDIDSEISWQDVTEANGTTREYICATGYVWTGRYPELADLIANSKSHSMEIKINSGEYSEIDGVMCYEITDFLFTALCILGDEVEPCFESSSVSAYTLDKDAFKEQFNQMLSELNEHKNNFLNINQVKKVTINNPIEKWECPHCNKFIGEKEIFYEFETEKCFHIPCQHIGEIIFSDDDKKYDFINLVISQGGKNVNEKIKLFSKFPTLKEEDVAELKLNIEQYSLEELEKKLIELSNRNEPVAIDPEITEFSLTAQQLKDEIRLKLSEHQHVDRWGDSCRQYWYLDHDDTRVYAEDGQNNYLPVGINYSLEGDKLTLDIDSKKRIKWVPQNLEDGSDVIVALMSIERSETDFNKIESELSTFKQTSEAKHSELDSNFTMQQAEFASINKKFEDIKSQYEDLHGKYTSKLKKEVEEKFDALFNEFSKELSIEEIADVKNLKESNTYEEIETKLFALVGKKKAKFSTETRKSTLIDLEASKITKKKSGKSYDELFEKYSEEYN